MLRNALERRAYRFIRKHGGSMEEARPFIDAEMKKRVLSGEINDRYFAETMTKELLKKGVSLLKLKQKLYQKGIENSIIEDVLAQYREDHDPRYSALLYAKKEDSVRTELRIFQTIDFQRNLHLWFGPDIPTPYVNPY